MRQSRAWWVMLAAVFMFACGAGAVRAADMEWPGTELSRHAQAWFAMLKSDEASARKFLAEHMAPSALVEASAEVRLQRRTALLERTQGLTPLEVLDDDPDALSVRCRAGNGDDVVTTFEAEPDPPHRIVGVRLEATPGDGGAAAEGAKDARGARPAPLDDAEAVKQIRARLDAGAKTGEFSGVALLLRGDATLLSGAWGQADRERKTPVTPNTRFNLASIGKILTRTAMAQLAEQGKLSLDDKLSRYLPDFPHADSITLDMLCSHRSGVGDIFNDTYDAMDRSKLRHNRDYLALIRDQPLWFAPGSAKRYSNGGYVLLGEVIAKASGEDYYDYLARHVYAPAAMKNTGAPIEGDGTQGLARGYTSEGAAPGAERDNAATRPARGSAAGGSYSTAADLVAFDRALLSGKLCSRAWAQWVVEGPRPDRGAAAVAGPPGFGFGGGAPGISTEWMHEGDLTLVVLTNRDPETARKALAPVRDLVRRMNPAPRRGRS